MTRCLASTCALILCSLAEAQLASNENQLVNERRVQAKLHNGLSQPSVPIHGLRATYKARIKVEWLDPKDKPASPGEQQITVPPEGFVFETILKPPANDELLARLRYRVTPAAANLTALPEQSGTLAFTEISPDAFVLSVTTSAGNGPDKPVDVHVIATNPKTGAPAPGVELTLRDSKRALDRTDRPRYTSLQKIRMSYKTPAWEPPSKV